MTYSDALIVPFSAALIRITHCIAPSFSRSVAWGRAAGAEIVARNLPRAENLPYFPFTRRIIGTLSMRLLVVCAKDNILTPPYFSRELAQLIPNALLIELARGIEGVVRRTGR
jgi:hypothetical protein